MSILWQAGNENGLRVVISPRPEFPVSWNSYNCFCFGQLPGRQLFFPECFSFHLDRLSLALGVNLRKKSWRFGQKAGEMTCSKGPEAAAVAFWAWGASGEQPSHVCPNLKGNTQQSDEWICLQSRKISIVLNVSLSHFWSRMQSFSNPFHHQLFSLFRTLLLSPLFFFCFCFFNISSCYGNNVSLYFDLTETLWSALSSLHPWIRVIRTTGPGESDLLAAFSTIWIPLQ